MSEGVEIFQKNINSGLSARRMRGLAQRAQEITFEISVIPKLEDTIIFALKKHQQSLLARFPLLKCHVDR